MEVYLAGILGMAIGMSIVAVFCHKIIEDLREIIAIQKLEANDKSLDDLAGTSPVATQELIRLRTCINEARKIWMEENCPQDGTDCVTPFDHILYGRKIK